MKSHLPFLHAAVLIAVGSMFARGDVTSQPAAPAPSPAPSFTASDFYLTLTAPPTPQRACKPLPRLSIGYDYASGDNARDNHANTFDQLFPTGHMMPDRAPIVPILSNGFAF